jgi:transposase-like protein
MTVVPAHITSIRANSDTWTPTELYCPQCGRQEVWNSDGEDYYDGSEYVCLSCKGTFRHPDEYEERRCWKHSADAVLEALRQEVEK